MKNSARHGASFDRGCDASIAVSSVADTPLMLLRQNVAIVEPNKESIEQ
jgi:hypothetical protein